MSNQDSLKRCDNYDLVVYLYELESDDTNVMAEQNVWSKLLVEISQERDNLLLLPIATDQNLTSLNLLIEEYNIESFPVVIINNKDVIFGIQNSEQVRQILGENVSMVRPLNN